MKYLILFSLLSISYNSFAQKVATKVKGGHEVEIQTSAICEMCQHAIEYELTYTKGVKDVSLNLDNKVVTVKFNIDKISADQIRERISKVGYHADNFKRDSLAYEKLPFCCKDGGHDGHSLYKE